MGVTAIAGANALGATATTALVIQPTSLTTGLMRGGGGPRRAVGIVNFINAHVKRRRPRIE